MPFVELGDYRMFVILTLGNVKLKHLKVVTITEESQNNLPEV
jgi:hypothetical protein